MKQPNNNSRIRMKEILLLCVVIFSTNGHLISQISLCDNPEIKLLKDINTTPTVHEMHTSQAHHNGKLYYTYDDGIHGTELWMSDGTPENTMLLADIYPGAISSGIDHLMIMNDVLYFKADDGVYGCELYRCDITAGTPLVSLVDDIRVGIAGGCPEDLIVVNNSLLFFTAYTKAEGRELWVSDGTAAGTNLVIDLIPGRVSAQVLHAKEALGKLFFSFRDPIAGRELWVSDGTSVGTFSLGDLNPGIFDGYGSSLKVTEFGSYVYFGGRPSNQSVQLMRSDGTIAGTTTVKKGPTIGNSFSPFEAIVFGSQLIMSGSGNLGSELYTCDGDSVFIIKDIRPGTLSSAPSQLTKVDNQIIYVAHDGVNGQELWKTDGTEAGTVLIKDIKTGLGGADISHITYVDGQAFFFAKDDSGLLQLWITDGREIDTRKLVDLETVANTSNIKEVIPLDVELYFVMDNNQYGTELWRSDASTINSIWSDLEPGPEGSFPDNFMVTSNKTFFTAHTTDEGMEYYAFSEGVVPKSLGDNSNLSEHTDGLSGSSDAFYWDGHAILSTRGGFNNSTEVWVTDGSTQGTQILDPDVTSYDDIMDIGDYFLMEFVNSHPDSGFTRLVQSDGTTAGTSTLVEYSGDASLSFMKSVNDKGIFILYENSTASLHAIAANGVPTLLMADIGGEIERGSSERDDLPIYENNLFFFKYTSTEGELWKTDGTVSGTGIVASFDPDFNFEGMELTKDKIVLFLNKSHPVSEPGSIKSKNEKMNDVGVKVWASDGTTVGTELIMSIQGTNNYRVKDMIELGDEVLFLVKALDQNPSDFKDTYGALKSIVDPHNGLWKTDGTTSGTLLIKNMINEKFLNVVSDKVYLAEPDRNAEDYLWISDGTSNGTQEVFVETLTSLNDRDELVSFGGQPIFIGVIGAQGRETYSLDVMSPAWHAVIEANANPYINDDGGISLGDRLIVFMDDGVHGLEPWVIDCSCKSSLDIDDEQMASGKFVASSSINIKGKSAYHSDLRLQAGLSVDLNETFEIRKKSELTVEMAGCATN